MNLALHRRPLALILFIALALSVACGGDEDEFAELTPCAEVSYPDTAGISPSSEPLISFYAPLDDERPLILREKGLTTNLILPDCSAVGKEILVAQVAYLSDDEAPRLQLQLNELSVVEVPLAELPRGESFVIKDDYLALQVVRVSPTEISGAVFVRYPHSNIALSQPAPSDWLIEGALVAPEDRDLSQPAPNRGEEPDTVEILAGTPELANLERFLLKFQGGGITGMALTIQGQFAGDPSINTGQMFFSPAPATPAEAEAITNRAREAIQRLYLDVPAWLVASKLEVEALDWGDQYLCELGNLFGREIGLRLIWSDPASGTVLYTAEEMVGLVRWTDFLWYVDVDHVRREVTPAVENRLWNGCDLPAELQPPKETTAGGDEEIESSESTDDSGTTDED